MVLAEGQHTMALDQSALLEVLEALKAAEVDDRIRQAAETIYQALILLRGPPHHRRILLPGGRFSRCWRSSHRGPLCLAVADAHARA
jgi:hypothetical protein